MPLAIRVIEGRYDDDRIAKVSSAIQAALMHTLACRRRTLPTCL